MVCINTFQPRTVFRRQEWHLNTVPALRESKHYNGSKNEMNRALGHFCAHTG